MKKVTTIFHFKLRRNQTLNSLNKTYNRKSSINMYMTMFQILRQKRLKTLRVERSTKQYLAPNTYVSSWFKGSV